MSVLIKGIDKPSDCIFCPLLNGAWSNCSLLDRKVFPKGTPEDCPLIELPPHGRLIDADALMENAQYKGTHDIVTAWDIVAAPTIIPAD